MSNITGFNFHLGFLSALLCCIPEAFAENTVDYNAVDVSSLQSQYQRQLKPKVPKKMLVKKSTKRRLIPDQELLQYQRILSNQQPHAKSQIKRKAVKTPVKRDRVKVRVAGKQRAVPKPIPVPRIAKVSAPRTDAIFEAASTGNVRQIGQLISQGVDVNQANTERETALHMAAAKGHYSTVIYLLNHGANIHSRTINNWLPIHHATRFRHAQIANYLKQKGSQIYAKTTDGLSAVDMAKALNDQRILGIFGIR